jgi:hypothetical protein
MEYFLYISDAKVDMLISQIGDGEAKKISSEIGIDLKLFSAKKKTEYTSNSDRIARLNVVREFIRRFGNLGTVEKSDQYIEDSLPMRSLLMDGAIVCYFGISGKSIIGLGGSVHHLIGACPSHKEEFGSHLSAILAGLHAEVDEQDEHAQYRGIRSVRMFAEQQKYMSLPTENLRFMAKRLVESYEEPKYIFPTPVAENLDHIILASPLYVSKED